MWTKEERAKYDRMILPAMLILLTVWTIACLSSEARATKEAKTPAIAETEMTPKEEKETRSLRLSLMRNIGALDAIIDQKRQELERLKQQRAGLIQEIRAANNKLGDDVLVIEVNPAQRIPMEAMPAQTQPDGGAKDGEEETVKRK